jgi:hypothetical protein
MNEREEETKEGNKRMGLDKSLHSIVNIPFEFDCSALTSVCDFVLTAIY